MILTFAWRNLWRNKLRSVVIIAAFAVGIFAGIFFFAFTNGMVNSRVNAVIGTEMSHIQLHKTGFLENDQFSLRIKNVDRLLPQIKKLPEVKAVTDRMIVNSMIANHETGLGVQITGIDPVNEIQVTDLHSRIVEGKYIGKTDSDAVIISKRLAKRLKTKLGDEITITVQNNKNEIVERQFQITGMYETENMLFDDANIFARKVDLANLTGISGNEAHEVAVLLQNNQSTEAVTTELIKEFPDLEVKNWLQLSPESGALVGAMNEYTYIFTIIILLALSFGIVNTMLMVIMERVHEIGMLMAIGMKRLKVFLMIMAETVFLAVTGGIIGTLSGWLVSAYFGRAGINLYFWKEAFGEMGFSSMIYPTVDTTVIINNAILVFIAGLIASLYPAWKAVRLKPVDAIHTV
ncbi:MAG: ABC transporter permease [Paludibacter sp.]|nr:ABC transporter permease [Paludibacter sp.]